MDQDPTQSDQSDEFVEQLAALDESVASGRLLGDSIRLEDEAAIEISATAEVLELADCLKLIDRVRHHSPDYLADLIQHDSEASFWIDGGDEYPTSIGRFEIRQKLGQGGFGLVFLAFDPELEREIALKLPRLETLVTEKTRQRFLREGKAAGSLNHANIAAVYESGRSGPICYIATAYCAGGSLAEFLSKRKAAETIASSPAEFRAIGSLIATLADAVQHAHNRGVLHRDLKPGNILFENPVTSLNESLNKESRIVDFGLARIAESDCDQTHTGVLLGTPAYMSPEQAEGHHQNTGPASDVYSLGAILYELIVGEPPFRRANKVDTIVAVRNEDPIPPRKKNTHCSRDLEAICLKCLEKPASRRYHFASDLADDLKRLLDGRSIVARSTSPGERLIRWCRRNPLLAGLVSAVSILLLVVVGGTTTAAIMLAKSNKEAVQSRQQAQDNLVESIAAEQRATENERLANSALYEARTAHAIATQRTHEVGRRLNSLDAIAAAARQIDQLGYGDEQRLRLRNVALRTMSLLDVKFDKSHDFLSWPDRNAQSRRRGRSRLT